MIEMTEKLRLPKSVKVISGHGQHILANIDFGTWTRISHDLWMVLPRKQPATVADIVKRAVQMYGVSPEGVLASIELLINSRLLVADSLQDSSEKQLRWAPRVLFDVTSACNLQCPFCFSSAHNNINQHQLTLKDIERIATRLKSIDASAIIVTGGEPLVRKDIVELLELIHSFKFNEIGLTTNGTLLNNELAMQIVPYLSWVIVSVDGGTPEIHDFFRGKGNFTRTLRGINCLKKAGMKNITIRMVACRQNLDDVPEFINLAKELGVGFDINGYNSIYGRGRTNKELFEPKLEEYENLYSMIWKKSLKDGFPEYPTHSFFTYPVEAVSDRCAALLSMLSVSSDGRLYPCSALQLKEYEIANLLQDNINLREILDSNPVVNHVRANTVDNSERCKECEFRYFCKGVCLRRQLTDSEEEIERSCQFKYGFYSKWMWNWRSDASLQENAEAIFGREFCLERN